MLDRDSIPGTRIPRAVQPLLQRRFGFDHSAIGAFLGSMAPNIEAQPCAFARRLRPFVSGNPAHATTPNSRPTPAVSAIANAPQKLTLIDAFSTGAPPARAATPPNTARKTIERNATAPIR